MHRRHVRMERRRKGFETAFQLNSALKNKESLSVLQQARAPSTMYLNQVSSKCSIFYKIV